MIPLIISLAVLAALFLIIFRKTSVKELLRSAPLRELAEGSPVEGETILTWKVVPPRWQRVAVIGLLPALFTAWIVLGLIADRFDKGQWAAALSAATIVVSIAQAALQPKQYRLTEAGLWCKSAGLFSDPESSKAPERRLLLWKDLADAAFKPGRAVLSLRSPVENPSRLLPTLMKKMAKKVHVAIPRESSQVEMMMREYVGRALGGVGGRSASPH